MSLEILSFTFNPFQENTYVLYDETKEAIIIDPGCHNHFEEQKIEDAISELELQPVAIVNTHCHIDHVFGVTHLRDKYNIPFYCHESEIEVLNNVPDYAPMFGLSVAPIDPPEDKLPDSTFKFGNTSLDWVLTPGHSPASICLIHHDTKQIIGGDVLFQGSIGRTDLPGGSYEKLMSSIFSKLLVLPDDYKVYSGHGLPTTIGEERRTNPFLLEYAKQRNQ